MLDTPPACETLTEAVDAYVRAARTGDGAALIARVQPSAVSYALEDGAARGETRAAWKARAGEAAPDLAAETVSAGVRTAIVSTRWTQDGVVQRDYAVWARLACRWRIVGRVTGPDQPRDATAAAAARATVDLKLRSDAAWSLADLGRAVDPRALVITIEDEEMAVASVAEWQARYAERARRKAPAGQVLLSRAEEGRGDLAAATWTFKGSTGATYADRAVLLKTPEGWRILALLWVRED